MRKLMLLSAAVILVFSFTAACRSKEASVKVNSLIGTKLNADLIDKNGMKIGRAELTQLSKGVQIHVEASGLVPGKHGFHIHENGVCEPPDFQTAGGHFNPTGKKHGFENPKGPHAGDLPNLFVGTEGRVTADMIAKNVTLQQGRPNSLVKPGGTSLVIHARADDYQTDPAGNSGARVACGVIR